MTHRAPWWILHVLLVLVAIFFMLFGIDVLYMSYHLNEPFSFVLTIFASNFIILISCALLIGFVLRIVTRLKSARREKIEESPVELKQ